ncbi:MAG: thioredoxin-disulfide reductase [Chloroflexota bacterium]
MSSYQVVIIGGGPAGLTAGIYTSRAGLKSLLLEKGVFGGQIVDAPRVENYPGFPEGISGYDLSLLIYQQATRFGLETQTVEVTGITPGKSLVVATPAGNLEAQAVIIAAGAERSRLNVPGESHFLGKGVGYCTTCDGFLFRDKEVAVVGGGDTAITDALELAQHATRVYLIHRRSSLRASEVLQHRVFAQPKVQLVWDTVIDEIKGDEQVRELKLRHAQTGKTSRLTVDGVFVAVGIKPNTKPFAGVVELDPTGSVVVNESLATSAPGIFAAGDIRKDSPRQVASAVGDGVMAATSVFKYLQEG